MNKKLLLAGLVVGLFATTLVPNENKETFAATPNGYNVSEVINDKFNQATLDQNWKLNGSEAVLNYSALHCVSPVTYGYGVVLNKVRLAEKTEFKFSVYPTSCIQGYANITFSIGFDSPQTVMQAPDVDCRIQLWDAQLVFTDWQHSLNLPSGQLNTDNLITGFSGLYSDEIKTDIVITIEKQSASLTHIYVEYYRLNEKSGLNEKVWSTKTTPFKLKDPSHSNGFCGFFWDGVEMDLTDFSAYNNGVKVFEDSLVQNTLTYASGDYSRGNFHVNGVLNEAVVYYANVKTIKMDSGNESICNKYELINAGNVSYPYELKTTLKINELNKNSFVGFGFGLGEDDAKIDTKNAVGFLKGDNDLTAEVVMIKNGIVDRSNQYIIDLAKLKIGKFNNLTIKCDNTGNVYIAVGGSTYKFSNVIYSGCFGIGLIDLNSSSSSNFELKTISLTRNVYNEYNSEDVSNDIKGRTKADPDDPDGLTNPYINIQKYFVGNNVSVSDDRYGNPAVRFRNAGAYSGFGYRKPYAEWICEFDVDVGSREANHFFGLSFGRKSAFDVLQPSNKFSSTYAIRCDNDGLGGKYATQMVWGEGTAFSDGQTWAFSDINFFDPSYTKFHMMFVAKNRNVYVYYKRADAPDSDLGILRSVVSNVNIDGFVTIVGNNGVSFSVTNFKIVNLADSCTQESELTLREGFNNGNTVSNKILLDATSKVSGDKLVLNNSSIRTTSDRLFETIRFTTLSNSNKLSVNLPGDKSVIFDSPNNRIIIKEGTTETSYDAGELNISNIGGKRFEITVQGNQITVAGKRLYDAADKLAVPIFTHNVTSPLTSGKVEISCEGQASIDDLYIFALDNSMTCATHNWENDPQDLKIFSVKKDYDPSKVYKPGCSGSIAALPVFVLAIGTLLVLVASKKRED